MRLDPFVVDHPAQQLGIAVGHVADQPLWLQGKPFLDALDHRSGCLDFGRPQRWRRFDIDDDARLHIDHVVGRVGVKRRAVHRRPTRSRICRRDRRGNGDGITLLTECGQMLAYGPCRLPRIAQILRTLARRAAAAIGVGLDHAGIDGKAFATDQPLLHAPCDYTLEHLPKRIALPETAVTVLREGRMVRYRVLKAESTEPAIGQIEMDLFAQSALGTNAKAVTDDQHSHYQLRIDRRPPGMAVERYEVTPQLAEVKATINPSQQVIRRNVFIKLE